MKKTLVALLLLVSLVFTAACSGDNGAETTGEAEGTGTETVKVTDTEKESETEKETETEKESETEKPEDTEPPAEVTYEKVTVTEDMISSSDPWNNGGDVAAKAFDGNTSTFFDGVEEGWIRVDLGGEYVIGKLGFAPRSGYESRLSGEFYGSLDGQNWYLIYDIKSAPSAKKTVNYEKFETVAAFRFVKYENISDCANISEFEIYVASGIPESELDTVSRDTYADGSYEILTDTPEDRGMTKIDTSAGEEGTPLIVCDNNPSTVFTDKGEIIIPLGGTYPLGAIAYMGGDNDTVKPADILGGEFYGSADGESWVLLYKITEAPESVCSTFVYSGELLTTGNFAYIKYENPDKIGAVSEIRVYAMAGELSVSLTTLPFATSEDGDVNNIALYWGSTFDADTYEIYRSNGGEYELVYTGTGTSWQDYDLPLGEYTYVMKAVNGATKLESAPASATAYEMPDIALSQINNQTTAGGLSTKSGIFSNGKYYSYSVNVSGGKATVTERYSSDGYNFPNSRIVIKSDAHELLGSCKIESVKVVYCEAQNKVIIAAHWEKPDGYADGKLLLITGTPGGEFTVHNIWNPLGIEVRDLSVFIDDDGQGYLLAAANKPGQGANATIYVFKFNEDFSDIESIVTTLFENQYREMPNVVKHEGWYYLFVSQAAGWYPSAGAYASSRSMTEGWSELRSIGNTSTFSSQSSWIATIGEGTLKNHIMYAYRWIAGAGTSGTMLAPITFSDGIAYYDFYGKILYNAETGDMVPVTKGKLLSQNCEVKASLSSAKDSDPSLAVDGDYFTSYTASSSSWPVTLTLDLGRQCELTNLQISWYICKGSEGYYMYTVEGSVDGESWELLYDNTKESDTKVSKTYGFNVNDLAGSARYVKITVKGARLQNNPDYNWYTPTIYEIKVYGNEK